MLNRHSISGNPVVRDPQVKVRVLVPIFVGGKECAIGDEISMATSDAQFAKNGCVPARVEIL